MKAKVVHGPGTVTVEDVSTLTSYILQLTYLFKLRKTIQTLIV